MPYRPQPRSCALCGAVTMGQSNRKFCSPRCRAKAWRYSPETQLRKMEERGRRPSKFDR